MHLPPRKILLAVIGITLTLICVFLFGYFIRRPRKIVVTKSTLPSAPAGSSRQFHQDIIDDMKAKNLEDNLRYFAGQPHAAASFRNNELGEEMHQRFLSYGFESKKESYNVLLSYPNKAKPNKASLINQAGTEMFKTQKIEDKLGEDENTAISVQPFNSYAAAGVVTGNLIYVNYGQQSDFKALKEIYKINCTNEIVIARYGKIGRGRKVTNAELHGAAAIIIFNDPANYAPKGAGPVFPNGWWLSEDGVQRGTIQPGDGDPQTPFYPSTDDAFRINDKSDEARLPKIPCHPISAKDAYQLLRYMDGPTGPSDWKGGLNLDYKIGPGFGGAQKSWKTKVEVYNERTSMKITNIIAVVRGSLDPDRYVLIGNHRDAWVNGAADPSSGTSVMMEVARAIGKKVNQGWKPLRSIVFCSWDGEEHGLIGSVEWTEQHVKLLQDRAVAYINLDTVVFGNYSLRGAASPLLHDILFKAAQETEDPFDKGKTAYDKYLATYPSEKKPGKPKVRNIGAGSDYFAFYHRFGIPSLDISYGMADLNKKFNTSFYPVYHTLHDSFIWMKNFVDPTFRCHLTIARVAARSLLQVADSPLIPWNVKNYGLDMKDGLKRLDELFKKANASTFKVNTGYLKKAIDRFNTAADSFHGSLKNEKLSNPSRLRMINDRLMQLEKGFVYAGGLPDRRDYSHMVFSPPAGTSSLFPSIVDALNKAKKDKMMWNSVSKQLSIVAATIDAISETLTDGF